MLFLVVVGMGLRFPGMASSMYLIALLFCTQLVLSFVKQKPDITYSTFFFSHNIFFWNFICIYIFFLMYSYYLYFWENNHFLVLSNLGFFSTRKKEYLIFRPMDTLCWFKWPVVIKPTPCDINKCTSYSYW